MPILPRHPVCLTHPQLVTQLKHTSGKYERTVQCGSTKRSECAGKVWNILYSTSTSALERRRSTNNISLSTRHAKITWSLCPRDVPAMSAQSGSPTLASDKTRTITGPPRKALRAAEDPISVLVQAPGLSWSSLLPTPTIPVTAMLDQQVTPFARSILKEESGAATTTSSQFRSNLLSDGHLSSQSTNISRCSV